MRIRQTPKRKKIAENNQQNTHSDKENVRPGDELLKNYVPG